MRKKEQDPRKKMLPSIALVHPVIDRHGNPRRVFYADEAQWTLRPKLMVVSQGSAVIAVPGQDQPQAARAVPVPVWEIVELDPEGDRGVIHYVPIEHASERIPVGVLERGTADGKKERTIVPLVELDARAAEEKRLADAGLVRGASASH